MQPHKPADMSRVFGKIFDKKCINIQKLKEKFEVKEKKAFWKPGVFKVSEFLRVLITGMEGICWNWFAARGRPWRKKALKMHR